jgi:hypothetical protein
MRERPAIAAVFAFDKIGATVTEEGEALRPSIGGLKAQDSINSVRNGTNGGVWKPADPAPPLLELAYGHVIDEQEYDDDDQNDCPTGNLISGYRCFPAEPFHDFPPLLTADPAPPLHRPALIQGSPLVRFAAWPRPGVASVSSGYFTRRWVCTFLSARF